jgi:hypothetical protein
MNSDNYRAWVFVSHSSKDLAQVRRVRNYLEERDASPLLFHLLALQAPEEFWPIIDREIEARNFFLYCDSPSAAGSPAVQRERRVVAEIAKRRAVRIGHVNVDQPELDRAGLDSFLVKTRVFPSYVWRDRAVVQPFLEALDAAGFQVFSATEIATGERWDDRIRSEIQLAARDGWVIAFLSSSALRSASAMQELGMAEALGARFVPVLIEPVPMLPSALSKLQYFDATLDPSGAPQRLVALLLSKHVSPPDR